LEPLLASETGWIESRVGSEEETCASRFEKSNSQIKLAQS
jgi:hypothetical protein